MCVTFLFSIVDWIIFSSVLFVINYLWLHSAVFGLRAGLADFSRSQIESSSASLCSAH